MDLQEEKSPIINWLNKINDEKIITQLLLLKKSNEKMLPISMDEKKAIDKAFQSLEKNGSVSNEEAKGRTKVKFPELFKW